MCAILRVLRHNIRYKMIEFTKIAQLLSIEVGICLTQVAPIYSMRGWWRSTPGT
jgi:hypothetical protein